MSCIVPGCKKNYKKNKSVSYFTFPKDPSSVLAWKKFCDKAEIFVPNQYQRVCSVSILFHLYYSAKLKLRKFRTIFIMTI
jgi:hypothetical protein